MQLNPYLFFDGDCREAFEFYTQCLGGKIETIHTAADTPMKDEIPPERRDKIMHARLRIGETVLMGSDAPPDRYHKPQGFDISITVDTPKEAERIFKALAQDGTVHMPIEKTFFAERFGMVADRFGIPWMILCPGGT